MAVMDKLKSYVGKNSDKLKQGIDKTTNFADQKTGGKYHEKLDKNARKARSYVDRQGKQNP